MNLRQMSAAFGLWVAMTFAVLTTPAHAEMFDSPDATIFFVDFRAAYKNERIEKSLFDYIVKNAKGSAVRIHPVTGGLAHTAVLAGAKRMSDKSHDQQRRALNAYVHRQISRASPSRPAAQLRKLDQLVQDAMKGVSEMVGIRTVSESKANVFFFLGEAKISVGRDFLDLDAHDVTDNCVANRLQGTGQSTKLDNWKIRSVGHVAGRSMPGGSLARSLASVLRVSDGQDRKFFGFGSLDCPDVFPEGFAYKSFEPTGPCEVVAGKGGGEFQCVADTGVAGSQAGQGGQSGQTAGGSQAGQGGSSQQAGQGGGVQQSGQGGGSTQQSGNQGTNVSPPPPGNPPVPSPSQGYTTAASAKAGDWGSITVTMVATSALGGTPSGLGRARILSSSAALAADLTLAGTRLAQSISSPSIRQRAKNDRAFGVSLNMGPICQIGGGVELKIRWSARGTNWLTDIRGFVSSCSIGSATTLSLGGF